MDNFDLKKFLVENRVNKGWVITNGEEWYAGAKNYIKFAKHKSQSNLYPTKEKAEKALSEIPDEIRKEKNLKIKEFLVENRVNEESNTNKAYVVIGFYSDGIDINDNTVKVFTDFPSAENYYNQLEGSPLLIHTTIN